MAFTFWLTVLTALAVAAVVARRLRSQGGARGDLVTDEIVRRIEREGALQVEEYEPLDLDDVRDEEDAFWSETWDEPEEI